MLRDTTAICRACEVLGGQAPLARLLGVSSPTVNQWVKGLRPVPIEHCPAIEAATKGVVQRWQLRATDWHRIWPELQRPAIESGGSLVTAGDGQAHAAIRADPAVCAGLS